MADIVQESDPEVDSELVLSTQRIAIDVEIEIDKANLLVDGIYDSKMDGMSYSIPGAMNHHRRNK